jgi:hypothetical protein
MAEKKDVLIQAKPETVQHKMKEYFSTPEDYICWWDVNGKPQKTSKNCTILFSDGEKVYAKGTILEVEEDRITFSPLEKVELENPKEPPSRGFKYVEYND